MIYFVINAGSSSLKSQLIEMDTRSVLAEINCERIGIDGRIKYKLPDGKKFAIETTLPDHMTTFKKVVELVTSGETKVINSIKDIKAVGHRIVFGGMELVKSVLADDKVIATIEKYSEYAPLHNPAEASTRPLISGISQWAAHFGLSGAAEIVWAGSGAGSASAGTSIASSRVSASAAVMV